MFGFLGTTDVAYYWVQLIVAWSNYLNQKQFIRKKLDTYSSYSKQFHYLVLTSCPECSIEFCQVFYLTLFQQHQQSFSAFIFRLSRLHTTPNKSCIHPKPCHNNDNSISTTHTHAILMIILESWTAAWLCPCITMYQTVQYFISRLGVFEFCHC